MEGLNRIINIVVLSLGDNKLTVGGILLASLLIVLGFLLARWLEKRFTSRLVERKVKAEVIHLIRRIFYILVIVILVITALGLLNVPLAAFAFISGALAIGVGFGAQNIINNFISGWILMWERPIRIGDWVEIGEDIGVVEEISTRSTRLKRVDGVHLLLPNSTLLEDTVINLTRVDNILRSVVRVCCYSNYMETHPTVNHYRGRLRYSKNGGWLGVLDFVLGLGVHAGWQQQKDNKQQEPPGSNRKCIGNSGGTSKSKYLSCFRFEWSD